jgi:menaquinol-cytochrome c reductase iron-sulfur subunit
VSDPDRRKFLATCAIGGGACLAATVPIVRIVIDPAGKQTVTTPREPLDLGPPGRFHEQPTKVEVVAPVIKDAWAAARYVVLGAAFIRRVAATDEAKAAGAVFDTPGGPMALDARSAICPHLGCAVGFDQGAKNYLCPCHDSRFSVEGAKLTGPSQRGLDKLPLQIVNGRVLLTWERYKIGQTKQEPA